jgi:hypothetical protein
VARTLYWRDGGILCHDYDDATFRHGYTLLVAEDRADQIRRYMAASQTATAWRVTQKNGRRSRETGCGSRVATWTGDGTP